MTEWADELLARGLRFSYGVERVLVQTSTPHQELMLIENDQFGRVLMLDGVTQVTTADEFIYHEMLAHVPLFAHGGVQDVLIVGGGDSAFDWALALQPLARSVTLVHRRDRFRAHAATVDRVRRLPVRIVVDAEVTRLHGDTAVTGADITVRGGGVETLPVGTVVAALGFTADLGPLAEWGLALDKRHILVDSTMLTNLPRVFAAGDITEYPGKVRLIATGFGEAATAVNNAAVTIDPAAHLFPGHSSDAG